MNGANGKPREPWVIKGADGPVDIQPGDYYINPKPRARRMCLNSLSKEARQVYACLELATMAFQQELAVTMEGGKKRPLTPGDIARQTELDRRNVANALEELEREGLAERKSSDGGALRKGHVLIYSWAVPRTEEPEIVIARDDNFPDLPPSWAPLQSLINRLRIRLSPEFVTARDNIERGEVIARKYEEVEKEVRAFLDCGRAQSSYIRKKESEITDITDGRSEPPPAAPEPEPSVRPPDPPPPARIRLALETWLVSTFRKIPLPPDEAILARIQAHIPDEAALDQFQRAASGVMPRKWAVFETVARMCAEARSHQPQQPQPEKRESIWDGEVITGAELIRRMERGET